MGVSSEKGAYEEEQAMDQDTWTRITNTYYPELLARAKRKGISHNDAEDIIQEVLKSIVNYKGRSGAEVRTYLIAALQNQVRRWIRKRIVARSCLALDSLPDMVDHGNNAPDEIADDAEVLARLLACIEQLPLFCRKVCELRHLYGHSYSEIAGELNIPIDTVKSRLHRARKILKEQLCDYM